MMPKPNTSAARQVAVGVELELVLHEDEARGLEVLIGHDDGPRRKRGQRRRRSAVSMLYSCNSPAVASESLQRRAWREQRRGLRVLELSKSPSKRDRAIASLYFDGLPINRAMIEAALIVGPERLGMIAAGVLPWVALDAEKLEPAAVAEIARARWLRGVYAIGRRRRRFRGRAASE